MKINREDSDTYKYVKAPSDFDEEDAEAFYSSFEKLTRKMALSENFLEMHERIAKANEIYYMILGIIGVPVNLVAIVILSKGKCGLSTAITRFLMAMSTADLLVVITEVILRQINNYYLPLSFLDITPVCSVVYVLSVAATSCSVWFTVTFTFDRFIAICCQKLKTKYCTERNAAIVLATTCILFCLLHVPFYFRYKSYAIVDNIPWLCISKSSYYTESLWKGFRWFHTVLTPFFAFILILLFNTLTVRHILMTSQVRKALRGQSKGENRRDPEMESRRKSVILLFAISGNFLLLWLIYVINFISNIIPRSDSKADNHSSILFQQVGVMLVNASCCTNTFIYGMTQSKFREQLKAALRYPRDKSRWGGQRCKPCASCS
ncbi:probable G-protein coupled receptor 139 [Chiloscyllium punctatum]|uniref:probable G-protein coupled receptor 139 n=1 Tax=Chiloscyllium punctatum TaxID=137246 RepID=UPI003B63350D